MKIDNLAKEVHAERVERNEWSIEVTIPCRNCGEVETTDDGRCIDLIGRTGNCGRYNHKRRALVAEKLDVVAYHAVLALKARREGRVVCHRPHLEISHVVGTHTIDSYESNLVAAMLGLMDVMAYYGLEFRHNHNVTKDPRMLIRYAVRVVYHHVDRNDDIVTALRLLIKAAELDGIDWLFHLPSRRKYEASSKGISQAD